MVGAIFKQNLSLDVGILLAMVVFMDQLAAQMPPMPDKVPIIGTVSRLWFTKIRKKYFLVFRCFNSYHNIIVRFNNCLSTVALHNN